MSVVIVGGNDRMATRYQDICKQFNFKSKVFTQMPTDFENKKDEKLLSLYFCAGRSTGFRSNMYTAQA